VRFSKEKHDVTGNGDGGWTWPLVLMEAEFRFIFQDNTQLSDIRLLVKAERLRIND
jgi:hypothetical protein